MARAQRRVEALRRGRNAAVAAAAEAQENNANPTINGCPVLDPIDCQCPKTDSNPGEGVKMTCTYEACPFQHIPLHTECYQLLEENLVKRLGTLGSARGWTVPQRRNNLWERKGQSLIGKFCRCRCGHGQMTRDKQALYEKEKAVEKEKKKKAKKAKQLPQLQFNSKPTAVIEEKREGKKRDSDLFSPTSNSHRNSFSTTTRSRLFTDRSTSSMQTIAVFDTQSELSYGGETSTQFNLTEIDLDEMEDDIDTETVIVVPAPPPPPQMKSYAATIKHEMQTPTGGDSKKMMQTPDSGIAHSIARLSASDLSSDEDADQGSGDFDADHRDNGDGLNPLGLSILSGLDDSSSESSEYNGPPGLEPITQTPQIPKKDSIYTKIADIRAQKSASIPKLPLATPTADTPIDNYGTRYGIQFGAPVREMMDTWLMSAPISASNLNSKTVETNDEKNDIGWTPFFGRGFNFGERLLYFP